jgi:hypothetical protein
VNQSDQRSALLFFNLRLNLSSLVSRAAALALLRETDFAVL